MDEETKTPELEGKGIKKQASRNRSSASKTTSKKRKSKALEGGGRKAAPHAAAAGSKEKKQRNHGKTVEPEEEGDVKTAPNADTDPKEAKNSKAPPPASQPAKKKSYQGGVHTCCCNWDNCEELRKEIVKYAPEGHPWKRELFRVKLADSDSNVKKLALLGSMKHYLSLDQATLEKYAHIFVAYHHWTEELLADTKFLSTLITRMEATTFDNKGGRVEEHCDPRNKVENLVEMPQSLDKAKWGKLKSLYIRAPLNTKERVESFVTRLQNGEYRQQPSPRLWDLAEAACTVENAGQEENQKVAASPPPPPSTAAGTSPPASASEEEDKKRVTEESSEEEDGKVAAEETPVAKNDMHEDSNGVAGLPAASNNEEEGQKVAASGTPEAVAFPGEEEPETRGLMPSLSRISSFLREKFAEVELNVHGRGLSDAELESETQFVFSLDEDVINLIHHLRMAYDPDTGIVVRDGPPKLYLFACHTVASAVNSSESDSVPCKLFSLRKRKRNDLLLCSSCSAHANGVRRKEKRKLVSEVAGALPRSDPSSKVTLSCLTPEEKTQRLVLSSKRIKELQRKVQYLEESRPIHNDPIERLEEALSIAYGRCSTQEARDDVSKNVLVVVLKKLGLELGGSDEYAEGFIDHILSSMESYTGK